jgi:hypothetical protein
MKPQRRREIHEPLKRLNRLRNRIAHHEPIHQRDLRRDHNDVMRVIAAICPVTAGWVEQNSSIKATLAARPVVPLPRKPS